MKGVNGWEPVMEDEIYIILSLFMLMGVIQNKA
jgi:hypothetical protein